ncbi:MAG: chromosome segregation protein SMC, partial [Bacteroidia bacterium]|nr:chromosome segregation protein SMC [Bacteroidia bacterium]
RNKIVSLRSLIGKTRELVVKANNELEEYRENLTQSKIDLGDQVAKVDLAKILIENLTEQTEDLRNQLAEVKFLFNQTEQRIGTILEQINVLRDEKESLIASQGDYSERLDSLVVKISDDHQMLQAKRESVNTLYEKQNQLRSNVDKLTFHLESLAEQIKGIYHNYFENYGKSLKEYDERLNDDLEDVPQLREELTQIKKQIQSLGYINHMAQEEFREIKERHDFLVKQMSDLEKAKDDLTEVIKEIRTRSEELFIDSFVKIREAFQDIFHRMFGGGRADLRLLDNDNILESGIDILAQPPGKKLDRLAPLSGGEKSLTAVALLFATYKVKPSPFCVLDEIDASLDDRNIGYFLSVLEEFSESSQFIIITHNKHTVMGSQTLLGVTMQEKGVSKAISYRMGYDSDKQVIYEDPIDISLTNTV